MFTDIVGSTEISARLDPEEFRNLIHSYHTCLAEAVSEFGGYTAAYAGDGVMTYFGWPKATERDAESAIRAGLAAVRTIGTHTPGRQRVQLRIGIASGVVVVGQEIRSVALQQMVAFGDAPNLASRLQNLAAPGTLIVDDFTRHQVGGLFICRDLGPLELRGYPEPVRAWQVLSELLVGNRFNALHGEAITPLIGREEELIILQQLWRQAKRGEGQFLLLSGEPGIGKSRLVASLEHWLAAKPHCSLRFFCLPDRQNTVLYPTILYWTNTAAFDRADTPQDRLRKLRAVMSRTGVKRIGSHESTLTENERRTFDEDVALIADLLSVPLEADGPQFSYSPQRKKDRTFEALTRQIINCAREQAVLVVFEDIHWADPSSLELLGRIIPLLSGLSILLVATCRLDASKPWLDCNAANVITLKRLTPNESQQVASHIGSDNTLPQVVLDRIVAQSDGIPLFIEELTKAVLEVSGRTQSATAIITVPATLRASLMARLDRHPIARQVAQIGSVIGREFHYLLLVGVAHMSKAQLLEGLNELLIGELVFQRGTPPDALYTFKHALIQEAAYSSLLRTRRAEIHASIVKALEGDPGIEGFQPALLGYHCVQAGWVQKAATYYRLAGEKSEAQSALAETKNLVERSLNLAEHSPYNVKNDQLRAELLVTLGRILHMTKGPKDTDALTAIKRAIELSRTLKDGELLNRGLLTRFLNLWRQGNYTDAEHDAQELVDVGAQRDDQRARILGQITCSYIHFVRGNFTDACHDVLTAHNLLEKHPNAQIDAIFGTGILGNGTIFGAMGHAFLGHLDQAAAEITIIADRAQLLAPFARASAMLLLSRFAFIMRDVESFRVYTSALRTISDEQGFPDFITAAKCGGGWLAAHAGSLEEGVNVMRTSIEAMRLADYRVFAPYWQLMLADGLVLANQNATAFRVLDEGLLASSRTGEAWLDAELYRFKANLLLLDERQNERLVESLLQQAIEVARRQAARLFELRAATCLARVWSAQGRLSDARGLLEQVHLSFTKTTKNADLQEARDLLLAWDS